MLEGLLLSLVNTLASFLFEQYLKSTTEVEVDGAPRWYYHEEASKFCTFNFIDGDYYLLERAKSANKQLMVQRIERLTDVVVYENLHQVRTVEERQMVNQFKQDPQLPLFVEAKMNFIKISYEEEVERVFVKGCIDKTTLEAYEKQRLIDISHRLSRYRAGNAFDELEGQRESQGAFKELEQSLPE
ncbi:hypothetical protein D5085_06690 [Ectothiorhodospiraceae bacterium BW-2]|nr:hypothetical protein D5085_06690 [Ectothiorhodospiraceae bacterium BW-2]